MTSRTVSEAGFTLVELLVATAAGLIVMAGATALMMSTLTQSAQVNGRVNVVAGGRVGMEQLVQQLGSGCLANDVSPVQMTTAAGISPVVTSDGNDLVFVSGVGDSTDATPTEHVVTVQNGALVDKAYANTGGQPPTLGNPATWTFASTPSQVQTLVPNVSADAGAPLFQYYSYANPANASSTSLNGASALPMPLGAAAADVARIGIDVVAGPPTSGSTDAEAATLVNAVTFRFSAAAAATPGDPGEVVYPCD